MKRFLLAVSAFALTNVAFGAESGAADPARLAALMTPCAECHGPEGASAQPGVPHLDRQDVAYLIESLALLAVGQRPTKVAGHVPADWTANDRRAVAAFYNRIRPVRAPESFDNEKLATGREVFLERCESCHENGGRDPDYRGSGSARLAGQRMDYLREQLRSYLGGKRKFLVGVKRESFLGMPIGVRGAQVRERLNPIGETEIEAIVHFLASNPIDDPKPGKRRARP